MVNEKLVPLMWEGEKKFAATSVFCDLLPSRLKDLSFGEDIVMNAAVSDILTIVSAVAQLASGGSKIDTKPLEKVMDANSGVSLFGWANDLHCEGLHEEGAGDQRACCRARVAWPQNLRINAEVAGHALRQECQRCLGQPCVVARHPSRRRCREDIELFSFLTTETCGRDLLSPHCHTPVILVVCAVFLMRSVSSECHIVLNLVCMRR